MEIKDRGFSAESEGERWVGPTEAPPRILAALLLCVSTVTPLSHTPGGVLLTPPPPHHTKNKQANLFLLTTQISFAVSAIPVYNFFGKLLLSLCSPIWLADAPVERWKFPNFWWKIHRPRTRCLLTSPHSKRKDGDAEDAFLCILASGLLWHYV